MLIKYYLLSTLISFSCMSNILGHTMSREMDDVSNLAQHVIPELDEMDRDIIKQTGCKYLSLAFNESVLFTKTSTVLEHTEMATLLSDKKLRDQNQTNFEMHFAIRSSSDLTVLMYSRRQYVNGSSTDADYQIVFGNKNKKAHYAFVAHSDYNYMHTSLYEETQTAGDISADKYEKLYVKLDDRTLKFGKQCDRHVISNGFATTQTGFHQLEIVRFGFLSKSPNGAKILYDCSPEFAGCDCGWWVKSYTN